MTNEQAEMIARQQWEASLIREQTRANEYSSRKPFARAHDNQEQKNRLNAIRAYTAILANLDLPASQRDPVAQYDIRSAVSRIIEYHTKEVA